jgi:hypothetical protein
VSVDLKASGFRGFAYIGIVVLEIAISRYPIEPTRTIGNRDIGGPGSESFIPCRIAKRDFPMSQGTRGPTVGST